MISLKIKRVVIPSLEQSQDAEDIERIVPDVDLIKEKKGKLKPTDEEKLMHSILEDDREKISDGKLLSESINQGIGSLTPELILDNLVKDYKLAKKLYGETIIRELTGYSPNYIEKNISIPEFRRELKKKVTEKIDDLKEQGFLNKEGIITDKGLFLSSLVLYVEELNHLIPKGFGERKSKKKDFYGDKEDYKYFKNERYRNIAIKQSIKTALRRGHSELEKNDLKAYERKQEGHISIIYGVDASGSMKGEKLRIAKKAGIALSFKALEEKNKVGIVVFGSEVKDFLAPTRDFMLLLKKLSEIKASMETDISKGISKAIELFYKKDTKHLVLLTDALPTKGEIPEKETLNAVSFARDNNVTISLIGINLDKNGLSLAKKIVEIGHGRLYIVKDLQEIDKIILEEYGLVKSYR
ncbi:MAG: VWA domain-containing protein [Candidatus Woesearchaeota archaeon]